MVVYGEHSAGFGDAFTRSHQMGDTTFSSPQYVGPLNPFFAPKVALSKGNETVRRAILVNDDTDAPAELKLKQYLKVKHFDGFGENYKDEVITAPGNLPGIAFKGTPLADMDMDSRGRIALCATWIGLGPDIYSKSMLYFYNGTEWETNLFALETGLEIPDQQVIEFDKLSNAVSFVSDNAIAGSAISFMYEEFPFSHGRFVAEIDDLDQLTPFSSEFGIDYAWGPDLGSTSEDYNIIPSPFHVSNQQGISAGIEITPTTVSLSLGKYANTNLFSVPQQGYINYPTFVGTKGYLQYGITGMNTDKTLWRKSAALSKNGTAIMAYGYPTGDEWKLFARSLNNHASYIFLPAYNAYGNAILDVPFQEYPDKVNFSFGGRYALGGVKISYEVYDVDTATELEIFINDYSVGFANVTGNNSWSGQQTITLPNNFVNDTGVNVLTFNNTNNPPDSDGWGVRNVSISN